MTDHCCQCHEHQVAFVANISLDELAQKRKQTLSKLNNSSGRLCSLWFFQTSLKKLLEKTPQNRKKNACRLSSLSLLANSPTPNSWNSPLLLLKDTPSQVSSHISDLAFDGPPTNECLNFSPANPIYDSASKTTQRQSLEQPNAFMTSELPGLGISLDDSHYSWTSSLATPPGYTAKDALPDEDETDLQEQVTKSKMLARALFSPDGEPSTLDDVGQLSTNTINAFKSCDKTPSAIDTQKVLSPNIPFSPVLFESKDACMILPKHKSEMYHNNPLSMSLSTSLLSGDPHATVGDNKLPEEISCKSFDTPVSRICSNGRLHSILSKKKHFSSTPKHVHFSESCLTVSDCDERPKKFNSADKLRQLRDSSESLSDLTLVTIPSVCLEDANAQTTIKLNKNVSDVEICEDSLEVAELQSDKDTSVVETPLTVIPKEQRDKNSGESTSLAALEKTDPIACESYHKPNSRTTPKSPPCSKDESSSHPSFTQSTDIKPKLVDSSECISSVVTGINLNNNSQSHNSSGYVSVTGSTNENHNANLKSLGSEGLSSMGSSSHNQSCQINPDSPELISFVDISENSTTLSKPNGFPEVSFQQPNPENLTVSPENKDDKNTIVFTQLSSSYDEKLISEVDRMSNRDLQETSINKPRQTEQCPQKADNIPERKEIDLDSSLLIIDDDAQLSKQNQKDTCTSVTPINNLPGEKPVPSKVMVSQPKTILNNSDTPTSSLSTPKFAISLCGKLRRKSKGFLYPTASQINHTSPLMALNFKVQGKNDNKPDYVMKGQADPSTSANPDMASFTEKSNQERDFKKSLERDLGSDSRTLVGKNEESSADFSNFHSTTVKQHEKATMDPLPDEANSQSGSQPKIVKASTDPIPVESPGKMTKGIEVASSSCKDQPETEATSHCKNSLHESTQTRMTFQSFPTPNAISNLNNQSPMNACQVSEYPGTEIHRKTKFYRSPILASSKSEPNPKSPKQHSTVSVVDPKSPELSQKTETMLSISRSPDKELSLISDSSLNVNPKDDQEMLEMNLLTSSQMVRWEEMDNFSEAFIEKDDSSSTNILPCQNDQSCSPDPGVYQCDSKLELKKDSSHLAEGGKTKEEGIQIYQNTNITSKAQKLMPSESCEFYKLSSPENEESIKTQSLGGFLTAGGKQISVKEESLKKAQNLLNEESVEAQSLGVFSTARGKQIEVKEESLKKAQNLLNDESIEAQSLGGFSTGRGKQISVKEESLKKAQNLLNEESNEVQPLGGFSTARGNQISVKEESLKKAQNLLNDESIEAQSLGGFSTGREKQISVKEESLKKAQNLLNDESIEAQSLGGFSTGRGKQISVKEESLKKAQNLLNDESMEAQPLGGFSTAKGKTQQQMPPLSNESHKIFLTGSANETEDLLSNEVNSTITMSKKENTEYFAKESDNTDLCQSSVGIHSDFLLDEFCDDKIKCQKDFESFGGFEIKIKEVKHLSGNEQDKNLEDNKNDQLEGLITDYKVEPQMEKIDEKLSDQTDSLHPNNQIGFCSPLMNKNKSILSQNNSRKNLNPNFSNSDSQISNFKMNENFTVQNKRRTQNLKNLERLPKGFRPFKAPRILSKCPTDTKSSTSKKYIENEKKECMEEFHMKKSSDKNSENENDNLQEIFKGGFSTACGKQISVKEESLKKAQNLLNEESVEAQSDGGFSTAGGKQISVKEESLKKAQNLLNEESVEAQSLGVFSTARGKQIEVKEESLKKAQNLLNDESMESQPLGGFSTGRGKQISVKEESLKKAQNLLNEESNEVQPLGGFSTARGNQISVKEESLKKAQNLLNDESMEAQSLGGFSTGRGKQISVKEESLKKAQNLLNDESIEAQSLGGFSTGRGKQISVKEESLKKAQNLLNDESIEAQSLGGFSTGRGKQISVKEESLKKAQNLLNDESMEAQSLGGFSTGRGKQISVKEESLKKAQNLLNDESMEAQPLGGFSTGRGKQISVKEESLKKAQNLLNDESMEAQPLGGFSTARGNQISVKEESLKKAQNLLNDESMESQPLGGFSTGRGKQISVKGESLKKAQNLLDEESIEAQSLGGFSTARGKQISVKEESLKKAQNLLNEESIEAQSLGGFSTARGEQINVNSEGLKKVENSLSEATIGQPLKSVKSVDNFTFQDENVLVDIVDAMDEDVVNDLLSTDFTASQMSGSSSSSSKVIVDGDINKEDMVPMCTLAREPEVATNYNHLIEDIFNCSWEDDSLSKKMQSSSVHAPNKLKRSASVMICAESGSTIKKPRIGVAENGSSLSVCLESSKNNSDGNKPCLLAVPITNTELGKFSKSQDISDDVLMQSVKIYDNPPDANSHSQIVSEDLKTESGGCDSKDQYLDDSDCSNESEMALAVEKLEGERKCSEISGRSTKQQSVGVNQITDHKISSFSGDKAGCPGDHSHHKFMPGIEKSCEINSALECISRETIECAQQKNPIEADMDKNEENHCLEFSSGKFPKDSSDETCINQERDFGTSQITSGFQTCLGQKVSVSNESLKKAVEMLNSTSEDRTQDMQMKTFAAFQTGLGKVVHVSEKALHEAARTLNEQTHCEESQNVAREILDAENPDEKDPACSKTKYPQNQPLKEMKSQTFIAFQTALGKDVPVSEKSINIARQILENPQETDHACSKAKYPRKDKPCFGSALHHKPENSLRAASQMDSDANSVPTAFKSLQHETNKINLLGEKQNSISWKPCVSTPEASRSGISPVFTDPDEILSDRSFGSEQHPFSDLVSRNPLDIEQRVREKTLEKTGQDVSSKKADFKTPYRKTPAISEVQKTVKVFQKISRPVFKGYGALPNSSQKECQKNLNSNSMSSTACENLNNVRRQSDRLKNKEPCKENRTFTNSPSSNDLLSSHAADYNSDISAEKSHLQKSNDKIQDTNLSSTNSLDMKSSTFHPKSSDSEQLEEEEITKKKVSSLGETKPRLVPDDPDADALSNKDTIPEGKENLPDQYQKTCQEKMLDVPQNAPLLVSLEDNSSDGEKLSRNLENTDKTPEFDKWLESKSTETLCSDESHLEEGRLEQDMIILRNKKKKILPQTGILTRRKASRKQIKLSDLLEGIKVSSFLPKQFFNYGIHQSTLAITSANATDYRFQLSAFYNAKCLHRIIIGDGAILVPDTKFTAGKEEFFRAFQTIEGVDPKLISPQWLFNHYKWIIWKLAAYEVALPQYFGGRCLSPEMVALQLKLRYDCEIDKCQRSALRRIIERDDTPAKRMVLCVSQINQDLKTSNGSLATAQSLASLEITDGWYSTKLFIDSHLSLLVSNGKLRIGQKLCISNAELVGSDTACSPLECPESIGLKVSGNCCRPAHWNAKLGYQADPRPLCLPLVQIAADGGLIGCVDVIVTRIYPIRYMEKVPGGGSVFRTSRAEKKQEQRHEVLQQEATERLYNRLQASIESTLLKQDPKQCKNWSRDEIRQLDNGQEIYEAMMCAIQPDTLLNCLSESQLVMLADYKRMAEDLKAQKMNEEFQKAISKQEHVGLKRNVTTVMKVRLVGCSHIDQQHKASTILTIWRPSEDLQQLLEEGQRYRIYNVMSSPARFSFLSGLDVHLTVTRSTHYESLKRHPSIPQDLFHPRKITSAVELQTKSAQENNLEVDMTGIVLRITKTVSANQRKHELLHAVDIEGNIFMIRFWGGLQIFSVNDLLLEEVVFAGLNLLLRHPSPQRGTSIPILDVCSEVSHFSVNPQQEHLRDSINQLHKLKASEKFLVKSREKLDSLITLEKSSLVSPKTPSTSDVSTCESNEARERQKMIQQAKCVKLLAYGSCQSLSPLSIRLPSTVRKAFKPPSITKPKNI